MSGIEQEQQPAIREAYRNPESQTVWQQRAERGALANIVFYRRQNTEEIGISWPSIDQDAQALLNVLNLIVDSHAIYGVDDRSFRRYVQPEIEMILDTDSPLFTQLHRTRGRRNETVAEHISKVARMGVSSGLSSVEAVTRLIIQFYYHDTGKFDIASPTQVGFVHGQDRLKDHAFISAKRLDELLYRVGLLSEKWRHLLNPQERLRFTRAIDVHHGLEDVAEQHISAEDLVALFTTIPDEFANALALSFADLGASGKPEYAGQNAIALVDVLDAYARMYHLSEAGKGVEEFERLVAQALSRVFYEMNQADWVTIDSDDEKVVRTKIELILTTVGVIFENINAFSYQDETGKMKLLPIIVNSLVTMLNQIQERLRDTHRKLYDELVSTLDELSRKYAFPIVITMQQPLRAS